MARHEGFDVLDDVSVAGRRYFKTLAVIVGSLSIVGLFAAFIYFSELAGHPAIRIEPVGMMASEFERFHAVFWVGVELFIPTILCMFCYVFIIPLERGRSSLFFRRVLIRSVVLALIVNVAFHSGYLFPKQVTGMFEFLPSFLVLFGISFVVIAFMPKRVSYFE